VDEFPIYFIGLLVVGTVLLLPVMAFIRSGQARSATESLQEEIRSLRTEIGRATARIVGLEKALEKALEKLESRPGGGQGPEVAATARAENSAAETAKARVVSPDIDKSETSQQVPALVIPLLRLSRGFRARADLARRFRACRMPECGPRLR
jgi:hypothetical protein